MNESQCMVSFAELSSGSGLLQLFLGNMVYYPSSESLKKEGGICTSGSTINHLEMRPTAASLLLTQQTSYAWTPLCLNLMYCNRLKASNLLQERKSIH